MKVVFCLFVYRLFSQIHTHSHVFHSTKLITTQTLTRCILHIVASQCLESSYEIAIDDEICKNNFDANLDLLALAEKSVVKVICVASHRQA